MNLPRQSKSFDWCRGEINSEFKRCAELDTIDWGESYAVFGCSHIFGTSQPYENTVCAKLQNRTGRHCVNLGEPSSGGEHHFFTAMRVLKQYTPKRSIFLWSYKFRRLNYSFKNNLWDDGAIRTVFKGLEKQERVKHLYSKIHTDTHWVTMDYMYKDTLLMYYPDAIIFDIEDVEAQIGGHSNPSIPYDVAPDGEHYGPQWNDAFVDMIMEKL